MPVVDQAKVSDPAWVQSYLKERTAAVEKQNELALELYKANPDHSEAGKLLAARWNNMAARSPAKALEEMEQFLKDHPDSKDKADVLFARAIAASRTPSVAPGAPGRVASLVHSPAALEAAEDFIKAAPKDERGAQLLSMVAMYARNKDERLALEK